MKLNDSAKIPSRVDKSYADQYFNKLISNSNVETHNETNSIEKSAINRVSFPSDLPIIQVVYATQSNTSKSFAEKLKSIGTEQNLKIKVKNISEVSLEDFNSNLVIVFIVSTYGEGEPTDDCLEFYKSLTSGKMLSQLNNGLLSFAVFGLGNTKYENYNAMGKKLFKFLSDEGINSLCALGLGNEDDNIRKDFNDWIPGLLKGISNKFRGGLSKYKAFIQKFRLDKSIEKDSNEFQVILADSYIDPNSREGFPINDKDYEYTIRNLVNAKLAEVVEIKELRKSNANGSTLKVTYKIDDSLSYEVGDNIGIYPENPSSKVSDVAKALKFDPELIISITKIKQKLSTKINIPDRLSIGSILARVVDLSFKIR